jgi:hypothetical protein
VSRTKVERLIRLALDPAASPEEARTAALLAVEMISRERMLEHASPRPPAPRPPAPRPARRPGPPGLGVLSDGYRAHHVWLHSPKDDAELPAQCYAICGTLFSPCWPGSEPPCKACEWKTAHA